MVLAFVLVAAASVARAQACGGYYVRITVKDSAGKPLPNADVSLHAITKDETLGKTFVGDPNSPGVFTISYSEGYSFTVPQRLSISAADLIRQTSTLSSPHART